MRSMEAISYIMSWSPYMFGIILFGAIAAVGYQNLIKVSTTKQEVTDNANEKIKKTLVGAAIALSISGFIAFVSSFYR